MTKGNSGLSVVTKDLLLNKGSFKMKENIAQAGQKTIFWNHLTTVDCAIILPNGELRGLSFNVNAEATGPLLEKEEVVIDFSHGKKLIKDYIDGPYGLDHKVLVPSKFVVQQSNNTVTLQTPSITATLPVDAVYMYDSELLDNYEDEVHINRRLTRYLLDEVAASFSASTIFTTSNGETVKVKLDLQPTFMFTLFEDSPDTVACMFSYTHGLPYSTSYGCQNILHGHSSVISLTTSKGQSETANILTLLAHKMLGNGINLQTLPENIETFGGVLEIIPNVHFVNTAYTTTSDNAASIQVQTTCRGDAYLDFTYSELKNCKLILIEGEPTIENLCSMLEQELLTLLPKVPGGEPMTYTLRVSEGLSKGCVVKGIVETA